MSHMGEV